MLYSHKIQADTYNRLFFCNFILIREIKKQTLNNIKIEPGNQQPNNRTMKRETYPEPNFPQFVAGELYLFHHSDPACPADDSLWGIYDKTEENLTYLENSSTNLRTFRLWHDLPSKYISSRMATRDELRDYIYNLAFIEAKHSTR